MEASDRNEKLGLLEWEKIWDMALEDDWIVPGFLSFERSHLIYGQSGLGKSLLTQEIAACASAGKSILGFPAKEPISVLYLDNENTALGDVRPRLREMGFSPEELANLTYLSFPNIPDLNSKSGGEIFNQLLEMYQPKLVILDTFSRFVDGEENSSATVQEFYKWCGKVMKKLKIAYIRIDHMGKDPEKEARGSSAKRDDVDLIWLMKEVTPNGRFELINKKSRVLIAEDRLILDRTSNPLSHRILSGIDWATLIAEAAKPDTALALITEYVAKNPSSRLGRTAVWTALKAKCNSEGISRKTLWDAIERYRSGEVDSDWLKEASIEI
jgi:RecA-family ATPase